MDSPRGPRQPQIADAGPWPDIYADGFSVSGNAIGFTLTLLRTEPSGVPGPHQDPQAIVGRIRMSPTVVRELAQVLATTIAQAANVQQPGDDSPKH